MRWPSVPALAGPASALPAQDSATTVEAVYVSGDLLLHPVHVFLDLQKLPISGLVVSVVSPLETPSGELGRGCKQP